MVKRALLVTLLALVAAGATAQIVKADGLGMMMRASQGVTVNGSPDRYVAISPNTTPKLTVVERINQSDGRVGRWWYLRGHYYVPAVAYDRSGGGLSADGRTLVLTRFTRAFPPRSTRFAILDTDLYLRHPRRAGQRRPRHAITYVDLRGEFSFDAISPDGSTIYLIHHYLSPRAGAAYLSNYEVRAFDLKSRRLLPEPIVDPKEPDERMAGVPITRAMSPDGRWAYTLYDGNGKAPFLHALDTIAHRAVCVDLPQLKDRRNLFLLRMRVEDGGGELGVLSRTAGLGRSRPLLNIDTQTFAVHDPAPVAAASSAITPWLAIGLAALAAALALAWKLKTRWTAERPPLEQA
ncbi:MAG: hypothetical protein QOF85_2289 [Solirubrobacterales bacterium]|jgi:hypothetical protein|nr:hypothetical protein [Solirubrobacterales bacterium]